MDAAEGGPSKRFMATAKSIVAGPDILERGWVTMVASMDAMETMTVVFSLLVISLSFSLLLLHFLSVFFLSPLYYFLG